MKVAVQGLQVCSLTLCCPNVRCFKGVMIDTILVPKYQALALVLIPSKRRRFER